MSAEHYEGLGPPGDAAPEDIKQAYRRKSMQHHPDRGGDASTQQALNAAFDVLSDPERRAQYDATGDDRSVDEEAAQVLTTIFNRALDSDSPTINLVGAMRGDLAQGLGK